MSSLVLIACLAVTDVKIQSESVEEVVDVIELHQCHDFRGRVAFRQLIFYRWSGYHRRFQVIDTVVVTDEKMIPRKTKSGMYCCQWSDENGTRIVRGLTFRNSKSTVDPEIAERDFLPTNLRPGLKRSSVPPARPQPTVRTSELPPSPQKLLKF